MSVGGVMRSWSRSSPWDYADYAVHIMTDGVNPLILKANLNYKSAKINSSSTEKIKTYDFIWIFSEKLSYAFQNFIRIFSEKPSYTTPRLDPKDYIEPRTDGVNPTDNEEDKTASAEQIASARLGAPHETMQIYKREIITDKFTNSTPTRRYIKWNQERS